MGALDDARVMPTKGRRLRGFVVLSLIASLVLIGGGLTIASGQLLGPAGAQRDDIGERLVSWVGNAKVGDHIALADLTDFTWDRVLIAGPYSANTQAQEQLGFAWDVEKAPSYTNEGLNVLAFADGDHIVAWSVVRRSADIWMPDGEDPSVYGRGEAELFWDGHRLVPAGYYPY